jgi:hypothetical protein
MMIKTGLEIVNLHKDYEVKIKELEHSMETVHDYGYSKNVLSVEMEKLQHKLRDLEDMRFQAMEPVVVLKSTLGGTET